MNVLAFILYSRLAQKRWLPLSTPSIVMAAALLACHLLPILYGGFVLEHSETALPEKRITIGMVQTNVNPWDKWSNAGFKTIENHLAFTERLLKDTTRPKPDLVLWPETAIPFYLITRQNAGNLAYLHERIDALGVPVISGLPYAVYYDSISLRHGARKIEGTGESYDAFNAAAMFQPGSKEIPWYGKMKMVPIAERVPYAEIFSQFDFLRWGVGIGGWQLGRDSTIFTEMKTGARFNTLICYESVYPEFVASFVRKGSEFIALITIDSWWAKMSGAYQHQRYSVFRAIENRRWLARCASGGISCFIDPYGREYDATQLFTEATLSRTIGRSSELSFYTRHGDWLGTLCLFMGGMFVAAAFGQKFLRRKRQDVWN
jgi:apolipoprotein N-acyltransferase